jgi:hypothetical protein
MHMLASQMGTNLSRETLDGKGGEDYLIPLL